MTAYVGKNHVPVGPQGYASGLIESSFDFWYGAHNHLGFYPKERHAIFRGAEAETQIEILAEGVASFLDPAERFIRGSRAFLERRPKDRPFCLTLAFNLPHGAGTGSMEQRPSDPELYRTRYRDRLAELSLVPDYLPKAAITTPRLPPGVLHAGFRQSIYDYVDTPEALRERMTREYQTITGIDGVVGRVRDLLARNGLAGNTVIIFASDHGILQGEFGLGGKALNYEACLRIPLIVLDPRVPAAARGLRRRELVQTIDLAPTMLELAGLPVAESMQGRSMVPLLQGRAVPWRTHAFAENLWSTWFGNPRCESVTSADWKYIRYFANDRSVWTGVTLATAYRTPPELAATYAAWLDASIAGEPPVHEELFHLTADPRETRNLAHDPASRAILEEMRTQCRLLVATARGRETDDAPAAHDRSPPLEAGDPDHPTR